MLCTTTTATGLVGGPSSSSGPSGSGGQGGPGGPDGSNRLYLFLSFKFETDDKMILKKVAHLTSKS